MEKRGRDEMRVAGGGKFYGDDGGGFLVGSRVSKRDERQRQKVMEKEMWMQGGGR